MKNAFLSFCLALAATPALADPLVMNTPVTVSGIETVCTGIGDEAQADPRWKAYPVRVEFSNGGAQYVSGAHVDLKSTDGKIIASVDCSGPWVLFRLAAGGEYVVSATLADDAADGARTAHVTVGTSQQRVVIAFPHVPPNH